MQNKMIKQYFDTIIEKKNISFFIKELGRRGDIIFIGGALRSYLKGKIDVPRDLDIVFDIKEGNLEDIIEKYNLTYEKNKYDGYKIFFDSIKIDIWELENTWAFREGYEDCCPENIVNTVFLNIDGVAFNYSKNIFYDEPFKNSIDNQLIDVVIEENPTLELNLLRALIINKDFGFQFSIKFKLMFINSFERNKDFINQFYEIQEERYGKIILSKEDILSVFERFKEETNIALFV